MPRAKKEDSLENFRIERINSVRRFTDPVVFQMATEDMTRAKFSVFIENYFGKKASDEMLDGLAKDKVLTNFLEQFEVRVNATADTFKDDGSKISAALTLEHARRAVDENSNDVRFDIAGNGDDRISHADRLHVRDMLDEYKAQLPASMPEEERKKKLADFENTATEFYSKASLGDRAANTARAGYMMARLMQQTGHAVNTPKDGSLGMAIEASIANIESGHETYPPNAQPKEGVTPSPSTQELTLQAAGLELAGRYAQRNNEIVDNYEPPSRADIEKRYSGDFVKTDNFTARTDGQGDSHVPDQSYKSTKRTTSF